MPNTPETVFKIGSISKQFTSMAIMMLEERGLLPLYG
ncbi:MAG: serine hydrolase [Caulobacteraceae bacterium]